MKGCLFIVVLLCISSYVVESVSPIKNLQAHTQKEHLGPANNPAKRSTPAHKPTEQAAPRFSARQGLDVAAQVQAHVQAAHLQAAAAQAVAQAANDSSSGSHVKMTPGAPCETYVTCDTCTDIDAKAFYCMWSAARNVCQSDMDMEQLQHDFPQDMWTKQCGPRTPEPITDCQGCPILAVDHKPRRDIIDSVIKGSDGQFSLATEGTADQMLGSDPNDPILGPITFPNGTNGRIFVLPSIRDDSGNIKDPIQAAEKLTYSACTDSTTCTSPPQFRSKEQKGGKIQPVEVGSEADQADNDNDNEDNDEADTRMASKFKPHVDKVEMQDAHMEGDEDKEEIAEEDSSQIEIRSTVKKIDGEGFTPTFSDDDSSPAPASPVTDAPRFKQTKRSETHALSSAKVATNSAESTMEVTEYDENVVGGKKINEDDAQNSGKQEADVKQ